MVENNTQEEQILTHFESGKEEGKFFSLLFLFFFFLPKNLIGKFFGSNFFCPLLLSLIACCLILGLLLCSSLPSQPNRNRRLPWQWWTANRYPTLLVFP